MNAPAYAAQMRREQSIAPYIPYSAHVTRDTVTTKDGAYIRTWKVEGVTHETADTIEIQAQVDNLNTLIRAIASNTVALWSHTVRHETSDRLEAEFDNEFCQKLNDRYYDTFAEYKMMAVDLYLTLVYRPHPTRFGRVFAKAGRTVEQMKAERAEHLQKLDGLSLQIESAMKKYNVERLTTYDVKRKDKTGNTHTYKCSQLLEFLNFLLTGIWQRIQLPAGPLDAYLGNAWVHVGTETIEIRTPDKTRYAQCIDFKDYSAHSEPGFLNDLMYEDYEFVITQSFSCMPKREGKSRLERQIIQLMNTEDVSPTQIEEMKVALDDLEQGNFCMGEYHYTLMIFGETVEKVRENVATAMALLGDMGFIASVVATATEAAFFAQLPANWSYRPRIALLSSRNFAGFSSFHNFMSGKRDNNPWGQAIAILKTPAGQPLYANFHATKDDEDSFDKKPLGNTRLIGMSGAGKTTVLNFFLCQCQKFKPRSPTGYTDVFLDKDNGAELTIRAVGGKYFAIQDGVPTRLSPLKIDPTETNIQFLELLVQILCRGETDAEKLTSSDIERISKAVRTVMRMPKEVRRLGLVPQNITEPADTTRRENSIKKRLLRWCSGGPLGWVFDNPTDELDFTTHSCYGIDGTAFLDNPITRTPISIYLLHRMESIIDGRRFIYWMDECWKWVDDPAFSDFAGNKQLTIRKQNGLGVFSTQMPSSLLESDIAAHMVQQCATEIYLPNLRADFEEYTTGKQGRRGFGLTPAEFNIVTSLADDSRMFLIKQGHRSSLAMLDLSGMDDELAILSGSTDNIELLHKIMAEIGSEDPKDWMPLFLEQINARKARDRNAKVREAP